MKHFTGARRGAAPLFIALVAALVATLVPQATAEGDEPFAPQLITVDAPTLEDRNLIASLPLDLTEHAGHDFIEVVAHSASDLQMLADLGYTWDVRIPDLWLREAQNNQANAAYAAATAVSPLPSGRTEYRSLADYEASIDELLAAYPDVTRSIVVGESLEGKAIRGIEISRDVHGAEDGRPTFLMFGLHHAREWPSGEHTIEFAYDLLQNYGTDLRITGLVDAARIVLVPVSNPDGFEKSYDSGQLVDLREVDGGGTVSILGTPSNAYKRKNCRVVDGQRPAAGECAAFLSPGGFGIGVDLNRNYGALWGGPGASDVNADPTYRGPAPFSEPETQAIRDLISSRQVTTLISNHTFSNLILRPNGVNPQTIGPDGHPVGFAPDEAGMKDLGARMAAQNGYVNQHGWELYDTTGTTEDYSYNATGGYGFTFEIGPNEFHPPFPEVIDEYLGAGTYAGKGNREAYLIALENAVDESTHSVIQGIAPAGATLRVRRTASTPTWDSANDFSDTVSTSMVVGADGEFAWHVNPSTRPFVQSRQYLVTDETPQQTEHFEGIPATILDSTFHPFTLDADATLMEVVLDWPTPDDLDLYVHRVEADGSLTEVASSGNFVPDKERALKQDAVAGDYVIEVHNYASVSPSYTVDVAAYQADTVTLPRLYEVWTVSCEVDGEVKTTAPVLVDRGNTAPVDLRGCFPDGTYPGGDERHGGKHPGKDKHDLKDKTKKL